MGLGEPERRPATDTAEGASPCAACAVRDTAFCGALNDQEIPRLTAIMQTVTVSPRGPIIDEGEPADYLFNVTQGVVKLYKLLPDGRRQITGFLFEGDFIGIAMNERYAYTGEAVDKVSLCRFPRRKLEGLLDEFPRMEKRLLGMASNELVQAQDQILLLGRKTAREKVVSFLLNLSDRMARRGAPASPISLTMGRADIADYLGLTTETVSRTITNLKRDGHIRLLQGNKVELPDLDALRELSEGW